MAKKKTERIEPQITIILSAGYAPEMLAPLNAFSGPATQNCVIKTADNKVCRPIWDTTWNNEKDRFEKEIDAICHDRWGKSFGQIKSVWYSRLGHLDDYWVLFRLEDEHSLSEDSRQ